MILRATIIENANVSSYLLHVSTTKDGIAGMRLLFDVLSESPTRFNIDVTDDTGATNGWGLEKTADGFLFQLIGMTPVNGFQKGDGAIYSYKIGEDGELLDWPSVEFEKIPKRCFLTKEQVEPLVDKLFRSDTPEESGGFAFDPECWEIVSTSD
jgi:hypothetical protein